MTSWLLLSSAPVFLQQGWGGKCFALKTKRRRTTRWKCCVRDVLCSWSVLELPAQPWDCFSPISRRNKALTVLLWLHLPPQLVNSSLFESLFFLPLLFFVPRNYKTVSSWALGSTRKTGSSPGGQTACAFLAPLYPLNAPSTENCLI